MIKPENYNISPALAQNLTYVELDPEEFPPLSTETGVYPRHAQLMYMINPSDIPSGGLVNSVNGKIGDVVLNARDVNAFTKEETTQKIKEEISVIVPNPVSTAVTGQTETLLNFDDNNPYLEIENNTLNIFNFNIIVDSTNSVVIKEVDLIVKNSNGVITTSNADITSVNNLGDDILKLIDVEIITNKLQIKIKTLNDAIVYLKTYHQKF